MKEYMTKYRLFVSDIRSNEVNNIIGGHFVTIARMYSELFAGVCKVSVAGGPVYNKYFKSEEVYRLPYNVSGTSLNDKWHSFLNARHLFRKAKGQIIVMQQSTDVTSHLAIALFYHGKSRLYMIRYGTVGINSIYKRLIYMLCRNKVDGIICPNDEVGRAYGRPYCVVPDYIYISDGDERKQKTYNEKEYDFCMIGRIAPEKGIIEAARKLRNTEYKVLIAGRPQNADIITDLHDICDDASNIDLRLEYVSDDDYIHYLNNSRYAILNYTDEYSVRSSGVVFDALFNGVPVVGRRCKALKFIEDLGLGLLFDDLSEVEPKEILRECYYSDCLKAIKEYKQRQRLYIDKLQKFILQD